MTGASCCYQEQFCCWLPLRLSLPIAAHWLDSAQWSARDGSLRRFWLLFGGVAELFRTIPGVAVLFYCGILLTFTAWILSINAAAQMRRWPWVALLLIAGYLTLAAVFASFSLQNCFTVPDGEFTCSTSDPLRQALITLGYLVSPMAALAYGIYGGRASRAYASQWAGDLVAERGVASSHSCGG